MPGDGPELVGDGESLLMGRHDSGEELAGELLPKVVEKVFHRAADAAVIIRRAEEDHIGAFHACLEFSVAGQVVGGVGIVKGQRFLFEIKYVHGAAIGPQALGGVMDDGARDRIAMQAADDRKDGYWLRHRRSVTEALTGLNTELI